jgi:hypothetical protein
MKVSKLFFLIIALSLFVSNIYAEIYIVKLKDNLTRIIQKKFIGANIYGTNGMLNKVLALNSKIKNANFLYVNQKIKLPEEEIKSAPVAIQVATVPFSLPAPVVEVAKQVVTASVTAQVAPQKRLVSNDQLVTDNWTLKVLYGAKFFSLDQSKTLTGLSLSTLATDNLKFESEFQYDNLKFIGSFESHSFSYSSSTLSHQTKLSTFELAGVWNNYLLGVSFKENPIIKATTTELDLSKESQLGLMIGHNKTWILPTTKPTSINLRSSITIPFKNSSDKSDVSFTSLSGFELKTNLELSRTIFKREDYALKFIWQNELMYGQTSRSIVWGTSNGKVNLTKIEAKSLVGLGFSF